MTKNVKPVGAVLAAILIVVLISISGLRTSKDSSAATGWASGACCNGVPDGQFAQWRGSPVPIASTWNDSKDAAANLWTLDGEYGAWTGDLDVAVGAIFDGENWGAAAAGDYDARWRAQARLMNQKWGQKKTIYIRFAHEMNGTWYPWSVRAGDTENFKAAWRRYYNIVQEELVSKGRSAKMVLNFNKDPQTAGAHGDAIWPGDQYVDVVGVDFYDMYPNYPDQAAWDSNYNATKNGGPYGIGAYKEFAKKHGKPLSFSEWGIHMGNSFDNPFYIEKMNEFFRNNAGTGPGQVLYETYFNTWDTIQLWPNTQAPKAAAKYRSLSWGGSGGLPTPPPTPTPTPTPPPPTPPTSDGPIRINAAGPAYTDPSGQAWSADQYYVGGDTADRGGIPIAGTSNPQVYRTERWGAGAYNIPVANGTYTYRLHFAETTGSGCTTTGCRIQSVTVEGQPFLSNFDIVATAGATNTAVIKQGSATITDGVLNINLSSSVNATEINGIEIIPASSTTPTPPTPTPTPGSGDANGDGRVNSIDYSILASNDGKNYPPADFNNDGTVGAADLAILLSRWTW